MRFDILGGQAKSLCMVVGKYTLHVIAPAGYKTALEAGSCGDRVKWTKRARNPRLEIHTRETHLNAELYSDGRMRPPDWKRTDFQVWNAISRMFAEKLEEERLTYKWENEELRAEITARDNRLAKGASV